MTSKAEIEKKAKEMGLPPMPLGLEDEGPQAAPQSVEERLNKVREARAMELRQQQSHQLSPGDPDETDENGIPFQRAVAFRPEPLAGPQHDGTLKYPLWTGKLRRRADGQAEPVIKMVPCSEAVNGGTGAQFYKKKKKWREVSEIPDRYAAFRDPYVAALTKWRQEDKDKRELQLMLARAGAKIPGVNATTTKTVRLFSSEG